MKYGANGPRRANGLEHLHGCKKHGLEKKNFDPRSSLVTMHFGHEKI